MVMLEGQFVLPISYDLLATYLFASSGALLAAKRGYDMFGVAVVGVISGAGGGILRDAIFLNIQPAFITNWRYTAAVALGLATVYFARALFRTKIIATIIMMIDATALGIYAVFGTQKGLAFDLSIFAAFITGIVTATGGSILRDVFMGTERRHFLPGQLYGLLATFAISIFLLLGVALKINAEVAAWIAIAATFLMRIIAVNLKWKSKAVIKTQDPSQIIIDKIGHIEIAKTHSIIKQLFK